VGWINYTLLLKFLFLTGDIIVPVVLDEMRACRIILPLGLLLAFCASLASAPIRTGRAAGRINASPPQGQGNDPFAWPGQTFSFEHLSLEDGLSQSSVRVILQDRRGFLWFGTEDGLNRYDGYTFKVFKPDPEDPYSLSDRWINTLYEDRAGNLWVGTRLGGLNRYDSQTGRFSHFTDEPSEIAVSPSNAASSDPASLSSNKVNAIYEDAHGILWVGTDSGLDWLDPIGGVVTHIRSNPEDSLLSAVIRSNPSLAIRAVIFGLPRWKTA
jgi:hypothetical protein